MQPPKTGGWSLCINCDRCRLCAPTTPDQARLAGELLATPSKRTGVRRLVDFSELQQIERRTWQKYLFYMDLAVIAIFCVSLILLVRHTFLAGLLYDRGEFSSSTRALWLVVGDAVFLVGSLGWVFYRFFKNQYIVLTRRF